MVTVNQTYYYAIVTEESHRLVLIDGFLPIFLTRTIAKREIRGQNKIKIVKISGKRLNAILKEAS
tara:strand:+ start:4193 stop:4387 length:195 start_codon:yes stop_codon:yes gene_type:complete